MTYKALVCRVSTRPHPNADKLLIGSCGQYQVIVGIDTVDGELGLFFECDGQLSEEFAKSNDLIRRKDPDGNPAGGMFEENRRVKSIKLRGVRSDGFWCPLSNLGYVGKITLKDGDQVDTIGNHPICNKYYTPQFYVRRNRKTTQRTNAMFLKHFETEHFKRGYTLIPMSSIIYISEKLHGTSMRYGHVLDKTPVKRTWLDWLLRRQRYTDEWTHITGTRNVVLDHRENYGESHRCNVVNNIVLHKGEVVYGEIVGYDDNNGQPIMAAQSVKDKVLAKIYGPQMVYSYGQAPFTCKLYVYRITQVNVDGKVTELSWPQVAKRCKELGIPTVPVLHHFMLNSYDDLLDVVSQHTEAEENGNYPLVSTLCDKHIREGVVVRYESPDGRVDCMKNKSFAFGVLEGYLKDNDNYVDTEEVS